MHLLFEIRCGLIARDVLYNILDQTLGIGVVNLRIVIHND